MLTAGLLKFQIALAIGLACWAFFTFSALPPSSANGKRRK